MFATLAKFLLNPLNLFEVLQKHQTKNVLFRSGWSAFKMRRCVVAQSGTRPKCKHDAWGIVFLNTYSKTIVRTRHMPQMALAIIARLWTSSCEQRDRSSIGCKGSDYLLWSLLQRGSCLGWCWKMLNFYNNCTSHRRSFVWSKISKNPERCSTDQCCNGSIIDRARSSRLIDQPDGYTSRRAMMDTVFVWISRKKINAPAYMRSSEDRISRHWWSPIKCGRLIGAGITWWDVSSHMWFGLGFSANEEETCSHETCLSVIAALQDSNLDHLML